MLLLLLLLLLLTTTAKTASRIIFIKISSRVLPGRFERTSIAKDGCEQIRHERAVGLFHDVEQVLTQRVSVLLQETIRIVSHLPDVKHT